MKTYVSCKIIQGEPMSEGEFKGSSVGASGRSGYKVFYPDGYISWSPTRAFENSHREILASELEMLYPLKRVEPQPDGEIEKESS